MSIDTIIKFSSKETLNKLRDICYQNNLNIEAMDSIGTFVVSEKDVWEGVEFAWFKYPKQNQFPFFKINSKDSYSLTSESGTDVHKNNCDPITESAYVQQIKKEAICKKIIGLSNLDTSMMDGGELEDKTTDFKYRKDTDTFYWFGCPIYQAGKWAKLKPKRIEVKSNYVEHYQPNQPCESLSFNISFSNVNLKEHDFEKMGIFIASQLEKLLNNEIGKEQTNG